MQKKQIPYKSKKCLTNCRKYKIVTCNIPTTTKCDQRRHSPFIFPTKKKKRGKE